MEDVPVTRAYLESLTTSDLIRMAESVGVDIPPELDRVFIIEEVLEICSADGDSGNLPENGLIDTVLFESAMLPKQYNISFIEVIIRDPLWAFVFWEVKAQDKEQIEKSQDFDGYYLKILPLQAENLEGASNEGASNEAPSLEEIKDFRIPVKPDDTAWYLGLSPDMFGEISQVEQQSFFKVEFCAKMKGEEMALAVSNPVKLPLLPSAATEQDINPLLRLSGYGDFRITRNNERQVRSKKVDVPNE